MSNIETDSQSRTLMLQANHVFASLHRRGALLPLLRREAVRASLLAAARELGLSVSAAELQAAADHIRRSNGLTSAADTNRWFAEQHLTILEWEDSLEEELLLAKLKVHVTRDAVVKAYAADPTAYDRVRYRLITTVSADLAEELRAQIREGSDFVRLAVDHSADAAGGRAVTAFRRDLGATADHLFAAAPGAVVGPVIDAAGFHLYLVEEVRLAVLDDAPCAAIGDRAFDAWAAERTRDLPLPLSILDTLR
jgi:parvulin-like peptidyl-prolyl isomerase